MSEIDDINGREDDNLIQSPTHQKDIVESLNEREFDSAVKKLDISQHHETPLINENRSENHETDHEEDELNERNAEDEEQENLSFNNYNIDEQANDIDDQENDAEISKSILQDNQNAVFHQIIDEQVDEINENTDEPYQQNEALDRQAENHQDFKEELDNENNNIENSLENMDKEEFINEASEEVAFEGEQIEVQNVKPGLVDDKDYSNFPHSKYNADRLIEKYAFHETPELNLNSEINYNENPEIEEKQDNYEEDYDNRNNEDDRENEDINNSKYNDQTEDVVEESNNMQSIEDPLEAALRMHDQQRKFVENQFADIQRKPIEESRVEENQNDEIDAKIEPEIEEIQYKTNNLDQINDPQEWKIFDASLKDALKLYSNQFIRSQQGDMMGVTPEFNVGGFSKFLSDFGCKISKIRINEIYNRVVVRNPELDEKGKPSKSIRSVEKFKEVLKAISVEEHKNSLINEKMSKAANNDKKMKSTRSTLSSKWNNFRVDSKTENEIFKEFLIRYGFGRNQEYRTKLKFISQPFKFLSDRLSFDKNILPKIPSVDSRSNLKESIAEKPKHSKKVTEFSSQINRIKYLVEEKFKQDNSEDKELKRNPNNSKIKLKALPKSITSKIASTSEDSKDTPVKSVLSKLKSSPSKGNNFGQKNLSYKEMYQK